MRILAIALNILLFLMGIYLIAVEKTDSLSTEELLIYGVLFAAPISALAALILRGGDSWISLYFERKAMEERNKIDQLKGRH